MGTKILRNTEGKIWANENLIPIRNRPFEETILQNGLVFWGRADSNYLTVVDGLVSEVYDIRGTGIKMSQSTVTARPYVYF